jgi:hypothetical protein
MKIGMKSIIAARNYRRSLFWSKILLAVTTLVTAWIPLGIQESPIIFLILGVTSGWAAICHQAEGFVYRKVFNLSLDGPLFLLIAFFSPTPLPIIAGVLLGTLIYWCLKMYVTLNPDAQLIAGDRFYTFRHPVSTFIPLTHLAPEPLSSVFDPVVAHYTSVGIFNFPIHQVSIFDPPALHNYLQARTARLAMHPKGWHEALTVFRNAIGILNFLDFLRKYEETDLDGVALAASARLALASVPQNSRIILNEVLATLKPTRRREILGAFDLDKA